MPYQDMYAGEGPDPARIRMATRSMFLDELDEHAESMVFDRVQARPSPMSAVQIRVLAGAMARFPADATEFAHRDRGLMVTFASALIR